ncbi:hypothetical protein PhCBS80983_g03562 [Powellomyces hirtus]|uniref:COP9 signalosome complex subunit 3 n=1 Tax=Powellomyces hirtus TaxID=109895 RepID=A0A507E323_9FUNG|nr:hypothetical protein PhCBS80983_g03562 [Powellomyces hirtus]
MSVLFRHVMTFMELFDPSHVNVVPAKMGAFGEAVFNLARKAGSPNLAVRPLQIACVRWSAPDGANLTACHPLLCKASLLAKTPRAALIVIDRDISEINPSAFGIKYQHFLLYHYYGGMIYTGLRLYDRACQFFKLCITAPGPSVSAIQIEAYRKFILVSLLAHGVVPPLPKYTSPSVLRASKQQCKPYLEFAQAYESLSNARIETEFKNGEQAFQSHGNRGIALQCMQALTRRNVQQLTETYLTLSLEDIAKSVGLVEVAETERLILRMIEEGHVFAKISARDGGMVSFQDPPQRYTDVETTRRLHGEITQAMLLENQMLKMDRSIAVSKDFVAKVASGERGSAPPSAGLDDEMFDTAAWRE